MVKKMEFSAVIHEHIQEDAPRVFVAALVGGSGISNRSSHVSNPTAPKHPVRNTILGSDLHMV